MKINKIRWRNLLSTGSAFTEIDLSSFRTSLIVGKNGAGKSTFLDALELALFGKPFRKVNKTQLLNSINNKDCLVELEFVKNQHEYLVRRGIKPNIFEVYEDGKLINQNASVLEYQEEFERKILQFNQKSFSQVVILGSANYVPFMQLTALARREVIEELLDLKVFSVMNTLNKANLSETTQKISFYESKAKTLEELLLAHQAKVAEMSSSMDRDVESHSQKIDELQGLIDERNARIAEFHDAIAPYEERLAKVEAQKKLIEKIKVKQSQLLMAVREDTLAVKHLEDDNCQWCGQHISPEFKAKRRQECEEHAAQCQDAIEKLKEKQSQAEDALAKLKEPELFDPRISIRVESQAIDSLLEQIQVINQTIESLQKNQLTLTTSDVSIKVEMAEVENTLDELRKERDTQQTAALLLKDNGVKASIIKNYVGIINETINEYLEKLDLFVRFELDENFEETIKSRHRDTFTYESFSEGEKDRIDLAILFTWREIARRRNSVSTNLLILDEVFDGSLDAEGSDVLTNILNNVGDSNVFVISHNPDAYTDAFERTLRFEKRKNYSVLTEA